MRMLIIFSDELFIGFCEKIRENTALLKHLWPAKGDPKDLRTFSLLQFKNILAETGIKINKDV